MKFNYKEFVVGVVIGGIILGGISSFANTVLDVRENPFKIKVNGENADIKGYNINGNSYFKLRDIGEEVGFNVDFKEDTILIDKVADNKDNKTDESNGKHKYVEYEEDGQIKIAEDITPIINGCKSPNRVFLIDGEVYRVHTFQIKKLKNTMIDWDIEPNYKAYLVDKYTEEILFEDIPYVIINDWLLISDKYFEEVIMPLDEARK